MRIPHAENATVNIRKLRDYCLNLEHSEGKHKARLCVAALGMTEADAESLRDALLQVVQSHDATLGRCDAYGQRDHLDMVLHFESASPPAKSAVEPA